MKELLQRYIKGEVSEKERLKIASWLDESPENMREFLVLRKLYDISLWQANTDKTNSVKKVHYSIRKGMAEILKIAAIFLIGFWGSKQLQIQQSNKKQMQTIHVPAGQRAEVTLADGTHVWLNSRSTLKFPEQFSSNARNVELDGEGYFSVQHNENSPFTVHTQNHDIQVGNYILLCTISKTIKGHMIMYPFIIQSFFSFFFPFPSFLALQERVFRKRGSRGSVFGL